jgi:hypothetical protein
MAASCAGGEIRRRRDRASGSSSRTPEARGGELIHRRLIRLTENNVARSFVQGQASEQAIDQALARRALPARRRHPLQDEFRRSGRKGPFPSVSEGTNDDQRVGVIEFCGKLRFFFALVVPAT